MKKIIISTVFLILCISRLLSNNIQVTLPTYPLVEQNIGLDYKMITFGVSWDNSWRTSTKEANWDAAWIFVKYRKNATLVWNHATLNYTAPGDAASCGHTEPTGGTITTTSDGKGVFLYSNANKALSSANYTGIKLRWNYGADGLNDYDSCEVCVYAIEMVYVPAGGYWVGSNGSESGTFYTPQIVSSVSVNSGGTGYAVGNVLSLSGGTSTTTSTLTVSTVSSGSITGVTVSNAGSYQIIPTNPVSVTGGAGAGATFNITWNTTTNSYYVANENAITVGTASGNLYYPNPSGVSGDRGTPIPASFPKGTYAFYCMKYEISQIQYVNFLNKLTRAQQANHAAFVTQGVYINTGTTSAANFNGIRVQTEDGINPRVFGCDLSNNGVYNEATDGLWKACNWLYWYDIEAYADWACLRPFSEFEFEKACRGSNLMPVMDEYVWGNTNIIQATTISNSGATNEIASNTNSNCNYGSSSNVQGPLRVGNFASGSTTRQKSGASYYGIMDLGGNLCENVITCGSAGGRNFVANNGNGILNAAGAADVVGWTLNNTGYGQRGGGWNDVSGGIAQRTCISDRAYSIFYSIWNGRLNYGGGRCVRTAP